MSKPEKIPDQYLTYFENMRPGENQLVWVATIAPDKKPHLVPARFVTPLDQNRIAIGCVFLKQTVANIRRNNQVTLAAVRFNEGYDGYMIKGTGEVLNEGDTFQKFKQRVYAATNGKRAIFSLLIVTIQHVYSLKPFDGRKKIL